MDAKSTAESTPKLRPAIPDLAAGTLTGDVRDFFMQWFQNTPKTWKQMSEIEQTRFSDAAMKQSRALILGVAKVMCGAEDFECVEVTVGGLTSKGEKIEAKIYATDTEENLRNLWSAARKGPITMPLVALRDFQGERAPPKIMADQPDLDLDEDAEEAIEVGQEAAPGDDIAAGLQAEALADDPALSPEAIENGETLTQGISALPEGEVEPIAAVSDVGETEPVAEAAPTRTKKPRRTAEQRVADNMAAAGQEPTKRGRGRKGDEAGA